MKRPSTIDSNGKLWLNTAKGRYCVICGRKLKNPTGAFRPLCERHKKEQKNKSVKKPKCKNGEKKASAKSDTPIEVEAIVESKKCKRCNEEFISKSRTRRNCEKCLQNVTAKTIAIERYQTSAEKRKIEWKLEHNEFFALWQIDCFYCGQEIATIGVDRIDSEKGYFAENIVPCCWNCNLSKRRMTKDEFIEMCRKISERHPR